MTLFRKIELKYNYYDILVVNVSLFVLFMTYKWTTSVYKLYSA